MPDIQLAEKKTVLQILESFKGTGPLRELLAQLNYDPLNEPVSRKEWPEPAQVALAQDPRLYGRAAGEFYVVYAQLAADKLKLTDERTVIPQLLKQYPYALFVFSDKAQSNFHFVNVKWENNQKRRLYRRITVGPQERMRTAAERLSMLDIQTIDAGLFGVTAQHIQDRHDEAFDVAKVSKSFFDEYKRVFEVMCDAVKGFGTSDEEQDRRHLFTQRLFNRLMFLRFIQKKGWLTIDGSTDYLAALWTSHGKLKQHGKNFYADRLRLLFAALNNERARIVLQGGGGAVEATIGKVKYLNGGLFEETEEDKDPKVCIADTAFKQIFDKGNGLFEAFNFTITESTPLDIEIAVDPEMLGKIFEELVTGRHDSGSYYTPKPIVSFMCREALKSYLEARVSHEDRKALDRFVDKHEPEDIHDAEAVLNALRSVTVCDPACGSGAYLLGMMHELLDLRQCLFQTRQVDNKTMYQRKLDIIQTNIYGVDVAEFAVNIARLRLWLSLAVDFDGPAPEPLPNLDYKIEVGDSLLGKSPSGGLEMGFRSQLITEFLEVKAAFLTSHHSSKATLKQRVGQLKEDIASFSGHVHSQGFDWVIEFAEVFVKGGGFDVLLANPPYLGFQGFMDRKDDIKRLYESAKGKFDYYVPFLERGLQCLADGGVYCVICPTNFTKRSYGTVIREILATKTTLYQICDFEDAQVFERALNYTGIFVFQKGAPARDHRVQVRQRTIDATVSFMPQRDLSGSPWVFQDAGSKLLIDGLRNKVRCTLSDISLGISEGIVTGNNDVFLLSAAHARELGLEDDLLRPCIRGRQVSRYSLKETTEVVIYPYRLERDRTVALSEEEMRGYPAVWKYLVSRKRDLKGRGYFDASTKLWYELWCQRDMDQLTSKKIVVPELAESSRFTIADRSQFYGDTVCGIALEGSVKEDLLYFLALLNSRLMEFIFKKTTVPKANGFFIYKTMFLKDLPILRIDFENDMQVSLYEDILKASKHRWKADGSLKDTAKIEIENEIDEMVYRLYGLTEKEAAVIRETKLVEV